MHAGYAHDRDQLQCAVCMLASLVILNACLRHSISLPGITSLPGSVYKQPVSDTSSLAEREGKW